MEEKLLAFWRVVSNEMEARCCTSTSSDYKIVRTRVEHEGLSFLTITLPTFARGLEKALSTGMVAPSLFPSFRWRGGLPQLFAGYLERVFDRGTGRLLDNPCVESIFAVRQLSLMYKKILLPCTKAREEAAIRGYVETEQVVKDFDKVRTPGMIFRFQRVSNLLWRDVFTALDLDVYAGDIHPSHGPGKTADKLVANRKFDQRTWPERLEAIFPFGEYAQASWRSNLQDIVDYLTPGQEIPVKVTLVPKTLKTPRIIAIEPTAMQYMQQALRTKIYDYLESPRVRDVPSPTFGMIGFFDQTPNQRLAQEGSARLNLATLDLSDASDRVSNELVRLMLHDWPWLGQAVDATRSRKARLPDGTVLRLAKYASMGSALCFPVEAMVFLTLIFLAVEEEHGRQLTRGDVKSLSGQVRVYGDDIVVPVRYVDSVIRHLEAFGLKVNMDKSFWTGRFRESCGRDYYDGHDVTCVYVRRVFPTERTDVQEIVSLVSLRNQMYFSGLWSTARWLDGEITKKLSHFPTVWPSSPVLGRHTLLPYEIRRECPSLHRPLVRGFVASSRIPASPVSGEGALLKCLLKNGDEPFADRRHLERSGRPAVVSIKLRWVPPF